MVKYRAMNYRKIVTGEYMIYPSGDVYNIKGAYVFKILDDIVFDFLMNQRWNTASRKRQLDAALRDRDAGLERLMKEWYEDEMPPDIRTEITSNDPSFPTHSLLPSLEEIEPKETPAETTRPCDHFLTCKACMSFHLKTL